MIELTKTGKPTMQSVWVAALLAAIPVKQSAGEAVGAADVAALAFRDRFIGTGMPTMSLTHYMTLGFNVVGLEVSFRTDAGIVNGTVKAFSCRDGVYQSADKVEVEYKGGGSEWVLIDACQVKVGFEKS